MFAPQHIMVAVDVSPTAKHEDAEDTVDGAMALARAFGARLSLLYVGPLPPPADATSETLRAMADVFQARERHSQQRLQTLLARALAANANARVVVRAGDKAIPELICEAVVSEQADALVLATHARTGLQRLLLGSVAERTAHLCPVPVLLLPPRPQR